MKQIRAGLAQQRQGERRAAFAKRAALEVRRQGDARAVPRPGRARRRAGARQRDGRRSPSSSSPTSSARTASRSRPTVAKIRETYGDKVRWAFRHFPLGFHDKAEKAGEAAACAGEQGKFWEMHDRLWANTEKLAGRPTSRQHAVALGLDAAKFDQCLDSGQHAGLVDARRGDGPGLRRLRHARVLRERPAARGRAAVRGVPAGHRRRAGARRHGGAGSRLEVSEDRRPPALRWAQRIQAIAQTGLTYARDPFDRQRYEELREIAIEMAQTAGAGAGGGARPRSRPRPRTRRRRWTCGPSSSAATSCCSCASRAPARWTFPGGWADVGDTPGRSGRARDARGERLRGQGAQAPRRLRQVAPRAPAVALLHLQDARAVRPRRAARRARATRRTASASSGATRCPSSTSSARRPSQVALRLRPPRRPVAARRLRLTRSRARTA